LQPEQSEFTAKVACTLYLARLAFDKKVRKIAKQADNFFIEINHPIYVRDFFPDVFGDSGTLNDMQRMETGGDNESMSDLHDTKYKTRLLLTWTEADTKAATEKATILVKKLRDLENDPATAVPVTDTEWQQWYSFDARFISITEVRLAAAPASPPAKGTLRATRKTTSRAPDALPQGILCSIFCKAFRYFPIRTIKKYISCGRQWPPCAPCQVCTKEQSSRNYRQSFKCSLIPLRPA
jgi:hypothetical protein